MKSLSLLLVILLLAIAVVNADPAPKAGSYVPSGTPSILSTGWKVNLQYQPDDIHANNTSLDIFTNLVANVYSLGNPNDCRLRVTPDMTQLRPGQKMPYVVPDTAAYYTDPTSPTMSNKLPIFNADQATWQARLNTKTNEIEIVSKNAAASQPPLLSLHNLRLRLNGLNSQ